ncbi:thioredoxin-dependent thiol peroxidase [Candidatus Kaiserbacteria bacterium CG10_big_fil_rev_8_21_14_0_10_45_20]|uniref:thioredoxin-dependent peroxiredoxin n=1 Tax=Candidatus Kaiserbacteria bacterium CG10_big_fil_rev_8_21_14_0_10_45_20 TaxID=1974607 RepID=A0A2H0UG00_9BACT|nr:MAG: thioredoxin-dependent thiol peroxidase [Candidatus Kaiserbacteria bacterium CG10_big_fil_rev_8_21_14_0_10_45_20]
MLNVGDIAPNFTLLDQTGSPHTLTDYRGRWVLIYFYPKDSTPGCTKEACMLRDAFPRFEGIHAEVFGISKDTVASHKSFAEKYNLPFPLLADEDKKVVEQYGVRRDKKMMGKTYKGIARTSFLIDPDGVIQKIYEKVKPEVHAEEVLADLKDLTA